MEHASPRLRSVDEGGYNLRSTQANTTHLSGPDTALDSEIPSNAFATAVPGEEEELVEADSTPSRTADVTSSSASRTSANPTNAGTRGELAGDARLPLDPSSAATSLGTTGQQNKQTVSGEDNLQQKEGGSDNPVNVSDPKSPEGHWLRQAELIQAHDRIGVLSSDAVAVAELLNQAEQENEGLRTHLALLEARMKEPNSNSRSNADQHPEGHVGPSDALQGQKRVLWQKEPAATATPQYGRLEMEKEALMRQMKELDRQMEGPGAPSLADAHNPRDAPPNTSISPPRHQEDGRQGSSAATIGLVEHFQAANRSLTAEVARLQRQKGTSTAPPSPSCQHPQEGGDWDSDGPPRSPVRYTNLAQQQEGQTLAPPQRQPDAQTAGLMELIKNLTSRLASVEKGAVSVLIENPLARSAEHCTLNEQDMPLWDWAMASRAPELVSQHTAVNIQKCYMLRPQLADKEQARHFWKTLSGEQLLRAFHDGLSHLEYTKTRVQLASKLYMFACALDTDLEQADGTVTRVLLEALENSPMDGKGRCYGKIRSVRVEIEALSHLTVVHIFNSLDGQFVPPTATAGPIEYKSKIAALCVSNGELPSYQLQVIVELTRVLRGARDSATVWEEAKSELISAIQKQYENYEILKPFVTKMSDITFADSDFSTWTKQFRAYEIEPRFKQQFASIGPNQESAGGRGEAAPRGARRRLIPPDGELEETSAPDASKLAAEQKAKLAALTQQIAAFTRPKSGPLSYTLEWVETDGVKGFPAPADFARKTLNMAKVLPELKLHDGGEERPGPDEHVGRRCIGCKTLGNPNVVFFHRPEFAEYAAEPAVRPRGIEARGTAFTHKEGDCVFVHKLVHEHVRKNPEKRWMFSEA